MTSAIETQLLVKHYPPDIRAVDGIDIDVPYGGIFAFLGANGSGKTTTVRVLTTLLRPAGGKARVDGLDVERDAAAVRDRIGVALQDASLDDLQTGRELLTLQAQLYAVPVAGLKQRVSDLLRLVDIEDAADRLIKTYSGGMKRRLDLAAALVHRPKIVFLDEPTTGLDPISRESIWREVQTMNRSEGVTFFLTTQYLEEADRLANYVAIIDRGKIVAQGSPAELKSTIGTDVITVRVPGGDTEVERAKSVLSALGAADIRGVDGSVVVYIKDGSTVIPRVVTLLNEASVTVEEVTLARPTLDDVFIRKTGHHIESEPAGAEA
jgi:ABC-2 type transport system ATP-binding protein